MNIMQMFKDYLPRWSEEKMQPIPDENHPDRWSVAWKDFCDTVLRDKHDELVEEYKSMQFKTIGMAEKERREKELKAQKEQSQQKNSPLKEEKLSEWEKVQRMLNE